MRLEVCGEVVMEWSRFVLVCLDLKVSVAVLVAGSVV